MPSPAKESNGELGRICPVRYRYGAAAIAQAPVRVADTLYVVGGLYGNLAALDEVERMVAAEGVHGPAPTLCFNGDFNWFNVDDARFAAINERVLLHDAIVGNVEAEFASDDDDAGCGCAYPDQVDADVVTRSNLIHARLKATARRHPALARRIAALPMLARYQVGACRVGVVHGDADSLAGWRFDVAALDDRSNRAWLRDAFCRAAVDVFASTHTCLPALRAMPMAGTPGSDDETTGWICNNGASGMPNLQGDLAGLCTRIGLTPSPHAAIHEVRAGGVWLALVPVRYDVARWQAEFLAQWPPGSAAWESYWPRISRGLDYALSRAIATSSAATTGGVSA
ncbi:MAG: hypothetical protein JNL19_06085 [Burkholderiales bacterium]|nr:hypothetical protein [Burkholderiales bacterium]